MDSHAARLGPEGGGENLLDVAETLDPDVFSGQGDVVLGKVIPEQWPAARYRDEDDREAA
jgi:hypothetical protein